MSGTDYVLLGGVLGYAVPLALAVRELILLRRGRGGPPPPRAEDPPPPKPLPDGLLPRPLPVQQRERELA